MKMETVEHFAKIALVTHVLGRQQPLGEEELEKLVQARVRYSAARSVGLLPLTLPGNGNHNRRFNNHHFRG